MAAAIMTGVTPISRSKEKAAGNRVCEANSEKKLAGRICARKFLVYTVDIEKRISKKGVSGR